MADRKVQGRRRFTDTEKIEVFRASSGRCRECKKKHRMDGYGRTWNIDHVIPVSRSGRNHQSNLALTCVTCNTRRGNKTNLGDVAETAARRALERDRANRGGNRKSGRHDGRGRSGRQRGCRNYGNPVSEGYTYCKDCGCQWKGCRDMAEVNLIGALLPYCRRHMDEHNYGPPQRWPIF